MLCRACGSEMMATETCPECSEVVLWKCSSCNKENDRSIHTYHPESVESPKPNLSIGAALGTLGAICMLIPL